MRNDIPSLVQGCESSPSCTWRADNGSDDLPGCIRSGLTQFHSYKEEWKMAIRKSRSRLPLVDKSLRSRADPKRLGKSARKESTSITHFAYMTLATSALTYLLTYVPTHSPKLSRAAACQRRHTSINAPFPRAELFFFLERFGGPGGGFGSP